MQVAVGRKFGRPKQGGKPPACWFVEFQDRTAPQNGLLSLGVFAVSSTACLGGGVSVCVELPAAVLPLLCLLQHNRKLVPGHHEARLGTLGFRRQRFESGRSTTPGSNGTSTAGAAVSKKRLGNGIVLSFVL